MNLTEEGINDKTKEIFERIQIRCGKSDRGTKLYASGGGQESGDQCEHAESLSERVSIQRRAGIPREWQADAGAGREQETQGSSEAVGNGERYIKKSDGILCSRNEVKYSFIRYRITAITQHKNTYPISLQCRVLGVNRSGYYHYRANVANKPADPVRQEMLEWVKDIAESSRYSYGSRRMKSATG